MAKLGRCTDGTLQFHCPGCKCGHGVYVDKPGPNRPIWGWNGSMDRPTFTPSIRVSWQANPNAIEEFKEWGTERCCHSFVTDGKIMFLADSTHALAGQTVEIPEWDS